MQLHRLQWVTDNGLALGWAVSVSIVLTFASPDCRGQGLGSPLADTPRTQGHLP